MFKGLIIAAIAIGAYAAYDKGAVTCQVHRDRFNNVAESFHFSRNQNGDFYEPPTNVDPTRWTEIQSHGARYGASGEPTPLHSQE